MNKERRKKIDELINALSPLVEQAQELACEEQDYFDNMPENMQGGDKGQVAQEAAEYLSNAHSNLDDALGALNDASQI